MDPAAQAREMYTQAQFARTEGRLEDAHRQLGEALTLLSDDQSFAARMLQADIYLSGGEMYMTEAARATSADPLTAGEPYGKASQQLLLARDIARAIIGKAGLVGPSGFTSLEDWEWPEVWARHGMALGCMARLATLNAVRYSLAAELPHLDDTSVLLARDFADKAMPLYTEADQDLSRGNSYTKRVQNAAAATRGAFLLTRVSNREAEQDSTKDVWARWWHTVLALGQTALHDPHSFPDALNTAIEYAAALQDKQTVQDSILAEP